MKKLLFTLCLASTSLFLWACGSEDTYPICNCELDEICVDDECRAIPDDYEPAPQQ